MLDIGIGMIYAFLVSLCMGGLMAWSWTLYRLWNRLPVYPPEPRLVANWGFAELLLCLGVYVLLTGLAGVVLMQAGFDLKPTEAVEDVATVASGDLPDASESLSTDATDDDSPAPDPERLGTLITADGIARILTIFVVIGLLLIQDRRIVERFGWLPKGRDIALGIVASCMLLPMVFGIQALLSKLVPYEHAVLEIISEGPPVWVLYAMAFTSMFVAPVVEEFFFRGVLQGWFQRLARRSQPETHSADPENLDTAAELPCPADSPYAPPQGTSAATVVASETIPAAEVAVWPLWPIVLSSLLFALVHFGQGAAPVALFFLALGLGYLYRVTGRLWASITVHFVLNTISTLMTVLVS